MTDGPKATIVIPTHERPELLARAIASALPALQEGVDEILVVNDHSSVSYAAVEARFRDEPRIRFLGNTRGKGILRARLAGMAAARNDLIVFLDDDDELIAGGVAARRQVFLERRDPVGLVFGDVYFGATPFQYFPGSEVPRRFALENLAVCGAPAMMLDRRRISPDLEALAFLDSGDDDAICLSIREAAIVRVPVAVARIGDTPGSVTSRWTRNLEGFHALLAHFRPEIARTCGTGRVRLLRLRGLLMRASGEQRDREAEGAAIRSWLWGLLARSLRRALRPHFYFEYL